MLFRKALLFVALFTAAFCQNASVIAQSANAITFEITFDAPSVSLMPNSNFFRIGYEGFGARGVNGGPQLCGKAYNIAVPRNVPYTWKIDEIEWSSWISVTPRPYSQTGENIGADDKLYALPYGNAIALCADQIWRGVHVLSFDIIPLQYNPALGVRHIEKIRVTVEHNGGKLPFYDERLAHPLWNRIYKTSIVNHAVATCDKMFSVSEWDPADGAEILVVYRPTFSDEMENYFAWKSETGFTYLAYSTSITGTTTSAIKTFITNCYSTWTIPPVYVLFVGDNENLATFNDYEAGIGDGNYGCVDGDDIIPDIFPGRLSGDSGTDISVMVTKQLNFEKTPDTTTDWASRAVGVVREEDCPHDGGPTDSSYLAAVNYAMNRCSENGFTFAHAFTRCAGETYSDVYNELRTNGASFVTYRGQGTNSWYDPFENAYMGAVGRHLPICVSITCLMGSFQNDGYPCEQATRAGTVASPSGTVCWFGQGRASTNSIERSSLSKHIFEGFFEAGLNQIAAAHTFGKLRMCEEFGYSYAAEIEALTSTLVGAPDLPAWTALIRPAEVSHAGFMIPGGSDYLVTVTRDGVPLEDARVCLKQGENLSYAFTNASGEAILDFSASMGELPLLLTVTGRNIYPYQDTLDVSGGSYVRVDSLIIIDYVGDGDGIINPGEHVKIVPRVVNVGDSNSVAFNAHVAVADTRMTWISSELSVPALAPDEAVWGDTLEVQISGAHLSQRLACLFDITPAPGIIQTRLTAPALEVVRFNAEFSTFTLHDEPPFGNGNGIAEAGEYVFLEIMLHNSTAADCFNLTGDISVELPLLMNVSTTTFEDLLRGTYSHPHSGLTFSVSPDFAGFDSVEFHFDITGECPTYDYNQSFTFKVPVNGPNSWCTGPDAYGYYIYDDTDVLTARAPEFVWNDISTVGTRISAITDSDDRAASFTTPFAFNFYGGSFTRISINSNGYVSFTGISGAPNDPRHFPAPDEIPGQISALMTDLAPHRSGDIYSYYDTEADKLYIQYDDVSFYSSEGSVTMQIVICNSATYLTPTNDSEIYFYYNSLTDPTYFSTGIESPNETVGIEYQYMETYPVSAMPIETGRALRITTIPPQGLSKPWIIYAGEPSWSTTDDDVIEPGESVDGTFLLANNGSIDASYVNVSVVPTEFINAAATASFGSIATDETARNTTSPLGFSVNTLCPTETTLVLTLAIRASDDYTDTIGIFVPVGAHTSVNEKPFQPRDKDIVVVSPNPFNASCEISIPEGSEIEIFDMRGNMFWNAISPKSSRLTWQPNADVASGVYFVRAKYGSKVLSTRALFIK